MALLIKSTTDIIPEVAEHLLEGELIPFQPSYDNGKKLKIQGTSILLEEIYCRILGTIDFDGVTMSLSFRFYDNKNSYIKDKNEHVKIVGLNDSIIRLIDNPINLITTAHDITKDFFEEYGYEIEIVDI